MCSDPGFPVRRFARRFHSGAWLVVAVAALVAPSALAGDAAKLGVVGFSADAKTFVLEEYGVAAGAGQPFAHLFFYDVDKQDEVVPAIRARGKQNTFEGRSAFERQAGLLTIRAKNWTYAERQLSGKADVTGLTASPPVLSWSGPRLVSETKGDRKQEVEFGPKLRGAKDGATKRRFEVLMTTKNLAPERLDAAGCAPFAFEVVLFDHKTKKQATLLKERRPASSRACTMRAEVVGIWVARGRVAVVLSYDVTGFEGPDTRHFAVTGRIP